MGAIRDVTASFDIPFVIGGMSFLTSALMHFFLMWLLHRDKRNDENKKDEFKAVPNSSALDV